jgi:hypothetical protein
MKKIISIALTLLGSSIAIQASAASLVCWEKYNRSNRNPVVTARIISDNQIVDLNNNGVIYKGILVGKKNPRARKYKGFNYFDTSSGNGRGSLVLPANLLAQDSYFYAASYGNDEDGGGTLHLNCLVR